MASKVLVETQFFPPIAAFKVFAKADEILIEGGENYQKRSYRNRCSFLNASGRNNFSIPLEKGKNQQLAIQNVLISYDMPWVTTFVKQLQSAYGKSPYYSYYMPGIEQLINIKSPSLFELNNSLLEFLFKSLQWDKSINSTSVFNRDHGPDICDIRNKFSPVIKDAKRESEDFLYPQVFEYKFGFTPGLSIIDLLFNTGPESSFYLLNG